MSFLADILSSVFDRRYLSRTSAGLDDRPLPELIDDLIGARGEVSGQAMAQQILNRYAAMETDEKRKFFLYLAQEMTVSTPDVRAALEAYEGGESRATYRAFMAAVEPPRQELMRRLNQVPGATASLVAMRADLLRLSRNVDTLQALDEDFRHLFASWFNRGFLVLRPINWESPAQLLEKIIAYEAVHAIDSWDDLRRRLQPEDRRCFAFHHPAMPDDPLIFVEVALTKGIPGSVQGLLAESRDFVPADRADTAVFYSISNCQSGLASISFGNSLIKQVVADLSQELPGLKTFVTLSPIPGLATWMETEGHSIEGAGDDRLRALAARYLAKAKRKDGRPLDPVARFHLGNGAMIHQVHAGADLSAKGLQQSAGVMVNYLYDLTKVTQNHERFASASTVAVSPEIRSLSASVEDELALGA